MRAAAPSSWTVKAGQQFKKKKKKSSLDGATCLLFLRPEQCCVENWVFISDLMVFRKFVSVSLPSGTLVSNSGPLRPKPAVLFSAAAKQNGEKWGDPVCICPGLLSPV